MAFRDIKKYRSVGQDDPHEVLARDTTPAEASLGLAPEGFVYATRIGHNVPQWWDGKTFHARYQLVDDPGPAGDQLEQLNAAAAPLRLVPRDVPAESSSSSSAESSSGAGVVDLTARLEQLAESSADPNTRAAVRETLDSLDELEGAVRQLINEAGQRLELVPQLETQNQELRQQLEQLTARVSTLESSRSSSSSSNAGGIVGGVVAAATLAADVAAISHGGANPETIASGLSAAAALLGHAAPTSDATGVA